MSLLDGVDAVVFDVDGTLLHATDPGGVRGAHAIVGAAEAVERVRATGRRVLFFTNGTGRPPSDYAADLRSHATSTAPVFSVRGGPAPGWSAAVVAGITRTTGRRATTLGKPSPIALREICRTLGVPPERTAVVGDDLRLELAMARRAGARAILVLTGISTAEEAREAGLELVLPDVTALLTGEGLATRR